MLYKSMWWVAIQIALQPSTYHCHIEVWLETTVTATTYPELHKLKINMEIDIKYKDARRGQCNCISSEQANGDCR